MIFNETPRFRSILKNDHSNTSTYSFAILFHSSFTDPTLKKYQILEKYLFSDAKAENGLTFRINISKYFSVIMLI